MLYLVKICIYVFLVVSNSSCAMQAITTPQQVILTHKKRSADELFAHIPPSLSTKPLVQLNALLHQTDTFSCVYRSLFHAQCISLALQRISLGDSIEKSLRLLLHDEQLLNRTFGYVKDYLDSRHPSYDRSKGLTINQLLGVCAASIPLLHTKLLPILLENDKKIYAVQDPTPLLPSPLTYSADFIRNYGSVRFPLKACHIELDKSKQLAHQQAQLNAPNSIAHFACRFPNHIFIASIVTDKKGYAKLYIIDSNNNQIATHESILAFTLKMLEYTEQHNAQLTQSHKKQKLNLPKI